MPTPTRTFIQIAVQYGNVDPDDSAAVYHWFTEVLPTLPGDTIEEIFETLLEDVGSGDDGETVRSYPSRAPLPSLSGSPAATIPLLAGGWRQVLLKLTGNRRKN